MNFESHRPQLLGVAYQMLGSMMDAEDVVQDAWLRYQKRTTPPEFPAAYLRKVVVNLSLDRLKSARMQREQYIGEWLPEPIATSGEGGAAFVLKTESVSMALLVVLESLSPLERAVFILHDVFDYDYKEIAQILDRSESACRKLLSRSREHIQANHSRYDVQPESHSKLVQQFMDAAQQGNVQGIVDLLSQDVVLVSDGGGVVSSATRPLFGRETIRAFFAGLYAQAQRDSVTYTFKQVTLNGQSGVLIQEASTGNIVLAGTFGVENGVISRLWLMRNPNKLQHVDLAP